MSAAAMPDGAFDRLWSSPPAAAAVLTPAVPLKPTSLDAPPSPPTLLRRTKLVDARFSITQTPSSSMATRLFGTAATLVLPTAATRDDVDTTAPPPAPARWTSLYPPESRVAKTAASPQRVMSTTDQLVDAAAEQRLRMTLQAAKENFVPSSRLLPPQPQTAAAAAFEALVAKSTASLADSRKAPAVTPFVPRTPLHDVTPQVVRGVGECASSDLADDASFALSLDADDDSANNVPFIATALARQPEPSAFHLAPIVVPATGTAGQAPSSAVGALLGPFASFFTFREFNAVQARCAPALYGSDDNVVIAAPTGSGKTALLELAILRLFHERLQRAAASTTTTAGAGAPTTTAPQAAAKQCGKAVYVCPIKALASERFESWQRRFGPYGLRVVMETGDGRAVSSNGNDNNAADASGGSATVPSGAEAAFDNFADVLAADIVITTPERWDSISRRWRQGAAVSVVSAVRLLLVDEVHVLGEARGAVIEALVSRMKTVASEATKTETSSAAAAAAAAGGGPIALSSQDAVTEASDTNSAPPCDLTTTTRSIRFIAVSGTIPNADDVAQWLDVPPSRLFVFSDADRPVPLATHVLSVPSSSRNTFQFDKLLTYKLLPTLRQYSDGKPALVFCSTRRECATSASHLAKEGQHEFTESAARQLRMPPTVLKSALLEAATQCDDATLKQTLPFGIAFHHAALSPRDRRTVETLFLRQHARVVCTTTTLAMGVNLPARLVVVKGTTAPGRTGGGGGGAGDGGASAFAPDDLPLSEVAQMCGRAGRAGLDTEGVAVVLASQFKAHLYARLDTAYREGDASAGAAAAALPTVESQLHRHMIEHLNAEICLGTITSKRVAREWLRTTFLWVRLVKNPGYYGVAAEALGQGRAAAADTLWDDDDDDDGAAEPAAPTTRTRRLRAASMDSITDMLLGVSQRDDDELQEQPPCAVVAVMPAAEQAAVAFAASLVGSMVAALVREGCVEVIRSATVHAPGANGANVTAAQKGRAVTMLVPTRLGRLMAQYYLSFRTVSMLNRRVGIPFAAPSVQGRFAVLRSCAAATAAAGAAATSAETEAVCADDAAEDDDADAAAPPPHTAAASRHPQPQQSSAARGGGAVVSLRGLLEALCAAEELADCRLRVGDKHHLNALNAAVRFPIHSGKVDPKTQQQRPAAGGRDVKEQWHKPFLLLQASIAGDGAAPASSIADWSLKSDLYRLTPAAARLARALVEYCLYINNGMAVCEAWRLVRSLEGRLWYDSPRSAYQLDGVGEVMIANLHKVKLTSIAALAEGDPRRIEAACGRHAPFGSELQLKAKSIPTFSMSIAPNVAEPPAAAAGGDAGGGTGSTANARPSSVLVTIVPLMAPGVAARRSFFTVVVSDAASGEMLCHRRFRVSGLNVAAHKIDVRLPDGSSRGGAPGRFTRIKGVIINESIVGMDVAAQYTPPFSHHAFPRGGQTAAGPAAAAATDACKRPSTTKCAPRDAGAATAASTVSNASGPSEGGLQTVCYDTHDDCAGIREPPMKALRTEPVDTGAAAAAAGVHMIVPNHNAPHATPQSQPPRRETFQQLCDVMKHRVPATPSAPPFSTHAASIATVPTATPADHRVRQSCQAPTTPHVHQQQQTSLEGPYHPVGAAAPPPAAAQPWPHQLPYAPSWPMPPPWWGVPGMPIQLPPGAAWCYPSPWLQAATSSAPPVYPPGEWYPSPALHATPQFHNAAVSGAPIATPRHQQPQHQQEWQVPPPPQWATASQLPMWPGPQQQQFGATPQPAGDYTPLLARQAPCDWHNDTVLRGGHRPEPTTGYAAGAQFSGATAACHDNAPFLPDAAYGLFHAATDAVTTARPANRESQAAPLSQAFPGPFAAPYAAAPRPSLVLPPRSAFTGGATRQAPDPPRTSFLATSGVPVDTVNFADPFASTSETAQRGLLTRGKRRYR
jgi:replicative superfamily II helicase